MTMTISTIMPGHKLLQDVRLTVSFWSCGGCHSPQLCLMASTWGQCWPQSHSDAAPLEQCPLRDPTQAWGSLAVWFLAPLPLPPLSLRLSPCSQDSSSLFISGASPEGGRILAPNPGGGGSVPVDGPEGQDWWREGCGPCLGHQLWMALVPSGLYRFLAVRWRARSLTSLSRIGSPP